LCFGIGAGAILQVVVEVSAYLHRTAQRAGHTGLLVANRVTLQPLETKPSVRLLATVSQAP
jgi:hypothetical protein